MTTTATRPAYQTEGLALADEIRDAVMLPPDEAMVRLGDLLERERTADRRVSRIRMLAAQAAVERFGSQAEVVRRTGLTRQFVSRVYTGHRSRP